MLWCSVKEAKKIISHLDDNDILILNVINTKEHIYSKSEKIRKNKGEKIIEKAESIEYQDNDIFGRFSLFGTEKNKDIVRNILFPQRE